MRRRQYLEGIAGLGAFSALPTATATEQSLVSTRIAAESHHPGPPRVMHAGEKLVDPLTPDYRGDGAPDGRSTLSPRIPGPERNPDNYDPAVFSWRIVEKPPDSEVDGFHSNAEEYDYGTGIVEEFDPDVPGRYVLELDAPDGTHDVTVRVFPEPPDGAAGPPRLSLDGSFEDGEFVLEASPTAAPDSDSSPAELSVEFLTDGRDGLSASDLTIDGRSVTVSADAVEGTARVHAVAIDDHPGILETVELDASATAVSRPGEPLEWIKDATMYEIFTRSFGSTADEVDFAYLESKADYLDELGIDVVWLTPVVAATSHTEDNPPGGPHGYDTTNYFETADALGSLEEYEAFIDACHARDIKVCFDLVINHTDVQHPFFADAAANGTDSPYYNWFERVEDGSPNHYFGWTDLMNINYQHLAMREHILAVVDFWTDIVDGFRCDIAYGVPHDFWKEVRQLVRAKDSDVFLLDEAIPYGARFSEGEFDVHFDEVLAEHVRDIGQGGLDAGTLLDAVTERKRRGVPDRTVFLQYVENHDMRRYLDVAGKEAERAAAAATFTLPGMPMVYYGQERAIVEHREPRLDEKGHFRAFMNWDDYDEEHLAFYKNLSAARDEIPALQYDADLVGAYFESDSVQVVAFGRDAGEQQVVVVLNFGEGSEDIALRDPVSTTDLVTNTDLGIESEDDLTHVEVDSVAVLETPSLSGLGNHVAGVDDETGDDDGPGSYTYPTGDEYADGAFDLTRLDLYENDDRYQFRFQLDGPVENPRGYDGGFSVQHFQVYVRDPTSPGGTRASRTGLNVELAERYQYRIVGDGEHGVRVETLDGEVVAEGSVFASPSTQSIRLDVPDHAFPGDPSELELAPVLVGYDPEAPGNVMRVGESAGDRQFGGGSSDDPQVVDAIVPEQWSQSEILGDSNATGLPYVVLGDPLDGELVERFEDPEGDDNGPGSYTYPEGTDLEDGDLDLTSVAVYDDGDRYRFAVRFGSDLANPWDGAYGFSAQHLQVYVSNPAADAPTATAGREGTNISFADPYHYRIDVTGFEDGSVVENGDGEVVSDDVVVGSYQSLNTISVSVPKSAVGDDLGAAKIAPLVFGYDPEGPGNVRQVEAEASSTAFGGGSDGDDPAVIDMVVPEGASQSDVLADGDALPFLSLAGFSGTILHSWSDETGDDYGPGSYTYPTSEQIPPDTYDITGVELYAVEDRYRFVYYLNGPITNPWSGGDGFSLHNFQVYIRDPAATDLPATTAAREGVNVTFEQPYHYRIVVDGYDLRSVVAGDGSTVSQDVSAQAHPDLGAIAFDVPADTFERDLADHRFVPMILGHDSYGTGAVRAVATDAEEWKFGGGIGENDPGVIDMITPGGVDQTAALEYSADEMATVPYVPEAEPLPIPVADAGQNRRVSAGDTVTLSGSDESDQQGLTSQWEQTEGPSVELSAAETPEATFTAPTVEEETVLMFEFTVTNSQGDSDTDSVTITVEETSGSTETPSPSETTTEASSTETGDGDGPGFGVLTSLVGTAGGAAYAGKRRLSDSDSDEETD